MEKISKEHLACSLVDYYLRNFEQLKIDYRDIYDDNVTNSRAVLAKCLYSKIYSELE